LTKDLHAAVNAAVGQEVCAILPMDGRFVLLITDESGFHFYRKLLDEMPDPAEAHKRRGRNLFIAHLSSPRGSLHI
jgi:hypothetical protein